jgi:hypothetical protein
VPENASLFVPYGIVKNRSPAGAASRFLIKAEMDGSETRQISTETLSNHWYSSGEKSDTLSLKGLGNRPVRLIFQSETIDRKPAPHIYWSSIRLLLPNATPAPWIYSIIADLAFELISCGEFAGLIGLVKDQ